MFNNVYPWEKYLKKIRPFYDSDIIKVITGIRRCGKSFILKAIMNELIDIGIPKTQIIYIPLDRRGYKNIKTSEELETKIESMLGDDENYYLFIDEVQNVFGFESVIHAYAEEGYSIFLTGSNSYLTTYFPLSRESRMKDNFGIYFQLDGGKAVPFDHVENRTLNARGNRFEVIYRSYEPIDGSYVDLIARENNSVYYKNNQGMKSTWLNCREG